MPTDIVTPGQSLPDSLAARLRKLGQIFERASKLPRRQQQKVIEMAEGFLALHKTGKGKTNGS